MLNNQKCQSMKIFKVFIEKQCFFKKITTYFSLIIFHLQFKTSQNKQNNVEDFFKQKKKITKFQLQYFYMKNSKNQIISSEEYQRILQELSFCGINMFVLNWKNELRHAYIVINSLQNISITRKQDEKYFPLYIEALKKKYIELNEFQCERKIEIMNELKKLFERYQNVFSKEFQEHLPGRNNDEEQTNKDFCPKKFEGISKKKIPLQNPRFSCCWDFVYQGTLSWENLEHEFISLPINKPNQRVSKETLEKAICGNLNYPKQVVIFIGLDENLQIVGMKEQKALKDYYEGIAQQIFNKSLKPTFINRSNIFNYIPIRTKNNWELTEMCIIAIQIKKKQANQYFIKTQKQQVQYQLKNIKKIEDSQLEKKKQKASLVIEQGRDTLEYQKKEIHCCDTWREPAIREEKDNFVEIDFESLNLPDFLKQYQTNNTVKKLTIIKFKSQNKIFQQNKFIEKVQAELNSEKKDFQVKRVKFFQDKPVDTQETAKFIYLLVFIHDFDTKVIQKIIQNEDYGLNFDLERVRPLIRLKDFEEASQQYMKRWDQQLQDMYFSKMKKLTRFYTTQTYTRTVYYQIPQAKENQPHQLVQSYYMFIVLQKLGLSPQFADEPSINSARYPL